MNYTRRPNRPDANVYRQMRRQSLSTSRRAGGSLRRGRGMGMGSILLLAIVLAFAGFFAWRLMH
jgi:hypothetical protein